MATKKSLIDPNLFAHTTPEPEPAPQGVAENGLRHRRKRDKTDPVKSYGVGLRASDWKKFFAMAEDLGTNYHDLAVYVLSDFMARWDRGERPPTETKQVLKRP
jgi:hypothetical protein